jgi:hypothetical protein
MHSYLAALGLNPPQSYPSAMRFFSKVLHEAPFGYAHIFKGAQGPPFDYAFVSNGAQGPCT